MTNTPPKVNGSALTGVSETALLTVVALAEGLLMYLQPDEAMSLIRACAQRFPGAQMMFDPPPSWFARWARQGMRTSLRYRVPPMPFSLTPGGAAALPDSVPGVRAVQDVPLPVGRGRLLNALLWTVQRIPVFDARAPGLDPARIRLTEGGRPQSNADSTYRSAADFSMPSALAVST